METARTWTEAFDSLLDAYNNIAENIPQFELYEDLFGGDSYMRRILEKIYEDILEFHRRALKFFSSRNWKNYFRASWNSFGHRFKFLIDNLERYKNLVEGRASLLEYENAKEARLLAETRFTQFEEGERKRQLRTVTEWLSPADFKADQETATNHRERNRECGRWLFKDKKISTLLDPQSTTVQSLWLDGIPGAGKTVLASVVIEEIRSLPSFTLAFFFCKHKDPRRDNFKGVLRALLVQLLNQQLDLLPHVYEECTSSGEVVSESLMILKDLFGNVLRNTASPFIVIDGIDECEQGERELFLSYLNGITSSIEKEGNEPPKVLYISRDEGDIRKILSKVPRRTISTQDSEQDIKGYTASQASEIQEKFEIADNLRDNIVSMVCATARGMFLYAYLVMVNLMSQTTSHELMNELSPNNFPNGLGQAYGRIAIRVLENPKVAERNQARKILGWILCATRPLKWYEIQGAASIDLARREVDFERLRIRVSVKDLCGSLVHIDAQDSIELVHSTARHYLLKEEYFVEIDEHRNLSFMALQYLVLDCFKSTLTDSELRKYVSLGYFSFMDYALQNWLKHVEPSASSTGAFLERLIRLVEIFLGCHWIDPRPVTVSASGTPRYLEAFRGREIHDQLSRIERFERVSSNGSAVLDLDSILSRTRHVIEQIATEKSGRDRESSLQKFYGPNLFKCLKKECQYFHEGFPVASSRDNHVQKHDRPYLCPHIGCHYADLGCRTLKELKAHTARFHNVEGPSNSDFPTPDPGKVDPFETISKGDLAALEEFLVFEPEVPGQAKTRANVTKGKLTLLKHAVMKNREEAVELLLKHGAKPDETGIGSSVTPLYLACEKGRQLIVKYLLYHGANKSYMTSKGLMPLHAAASAGHTSCVQILIAKGAPISATDPSGHQPLYLALVEKHFDTVSSLIELGADPLVSSVVHLLMKDEYKSFRDSLVDRGHLTNTLGPVLLYEAIERDLDDLACSLLESGVSPGTLNQGVDPLPGAVHRNNVRVASLLLEKGADPNGHGGGARLLSTAIDNDNVIMTRLLLKNGLSTHTDGIMRHSLSGHDPMITQSPNMAALLLIHGVAADRFASADLILPSDSTRIFLDSEFCALFAAIGQKVQIRFDNGKNLLHIASSLGYEQTLRLMIKSGVDLNVQCDQKRSALHYAVDEPRTTALELLLEGHIDTEIQDSKGLTALWYAFQNDNMEMAITLLDHGADSEATNGPAQESLLHYAVFKNSFAALKMLASEYSVPLSLNYREWSPLHLAVTMGNKEIIQLLLDEALKPSGRSAHLMTDVMKRSLLHLAAMHGQDEALEQVLKYDLDIEDVDINGCTALHLATVEGHEDVVETLLNLGANFNAQTFEGVSSLHIAARSNYLGIATILLDHGADPNQGKTRGWAPLHLAVHEGCGEMISLLKSRGANVSAVTDDGHTALQIASDLGLPEAELLREP